jgi:hypothetical protein
MNALNTRLKELEARFERLIVDHQLLKTQIAALNNQLQALQGQGGNGQGGGWGQLYWAHAASGISAATGSWPTITPATFTSDIYADVGGTWAKQATSQTVRWFYKDTAAANSLVPVVPCDGGTAWDAIGNSCTAV